MLVSVYSSCKAGTKCLPLSGKAPTQAAFWTQSRAQRNCERHFMHEPNSTRGPYRMGGPMQISNRVTRAVSHLRQALAGLLLGHVALGDVLLEGREKRSEEGNVVPEQARLCDAARVERRKCDARLVMEPPVQLADCQHVAHLDRQTNRVCQDPTFVCGRNHTSHTSLRQMGCETKTLCWRAHLNRVLRQSCKKSLVL